MGTERMDDPRSKMLKALNRLTKWRTVFTGWQLGTRSKGDPEGDAVRDHREATMILRAEVTALVGLMTEKGVFTIEEFQEAVAFEADMLSQSFAQRFPGIKATDEGIEMDAAELARHGTMEGWKP
jgi:hypothetical protein